MRLEVESALQVGGLPAPAANLVPESSHPGSTAATGSESAPTPAASKSTYYSVRCALLCILFSMHCVDFALLQTS